MAGPGKFMAGERINRKLAAILAADVVGYSRLMAADETGTLAALKRHRETVFDPAGAVHNGRIVKLIGDGTIVEFASVVDAVNCALTVQRSSARAPGQQTGQPSIVLRIGINLGDVIMERDGFLPRRASLSARSSRSSRRGVPDMGRAQGDQPEIFLQRIHRPATPAAGRRRAHRRRARQSRTVELTDWLVAADGSLPFRQCSR